MCSRTASFPPSFFSWPAIITNIPARCSGTRPIGLGTKAAEKVLKACQRYLTCISQVLYKAKSLWARRTVGGPRGPRHSPPPRAKMRPGWGDSREGTRRGTVEGNSRAQHDENLQFSSSLGSSSFSLVKEKGAKVKTQNEKSPYKKHLVRFLGHSNALKMGSRWGPHVLGAEGWVARAGGSRGWGHPMAPSHPVPMGTERLNPAGAATAQVLRVSRGLCQELKGLVKSGWFCWKLSLKGTREKKKKKK